MVRTVRVRLELDRNDYKAGLRDAATATRGFDTEVKAVGRDADRTGTQLKDTGTTARKLGDDVKQSTRETANLGRELETTRGKLRDLGNEYKRTGSVELDRYRSLTSELRKLERAKRDLDKLGGQDQGGTTGLLGGLLGKGLGAASGFQPGSTFGLSPTAVTAALATIAAAAPAAGAAIAAAILAGIGAAGLGAGIALELKDPQIQAAGKAMGADIGAHLQDAAVTDFREPMLASMAILGAGFDRFEPRIRRIFAGLAPQLEDLARGIVGLVDEVGPGLEHAFAAAGPMIREIAQDLPQIGAAIGFFLDRIAAAGPGAVTFFHDLAMGAEATLTTLGLATEGLSKLYQLMAGGPSKFGGPGSPFTGTLFTLMNVLDQTDEKQKKASGSADELASQWRKMFDEANKVSDAAQTAGLGVSLAADDFAKLSSQIASAGTNSDLLAAKMVDKVLGATLGLDQATLGFAQALTQTSDAIKNNGTQLDIHTAKGQANRSAILGAVQANLADYDAMIRSGAGAEQAAAAYNTNTAALEAQLRKAGLTAGQIDQLIGKYRNVPSKVDTDVAVKGLTEAINNLDETIRLINGLQSRTVYEDVVVRHSVVGPATAFARGGVVSYAEGGVHDYKMSLRPDYTARGGLLKPSNPGTILAGEPSTGGEVFGPRLGVSHERGLQLAGVLAGWHGGMVVRPTGTAGAGVASVTNVNVTVNAGMGADGMAVGRQIAEVLRPYIRSAGGGNVQVALGKRGA